MTAEGIALPTSNPTVKARDMATGFRRMEPRRKVEIDEKTRLLKLSGKGTVNIQPDKAFEDAKAFTVEAVSERCALKWDPLGPD